MTVICYLPKNYIFSFTVFNPCIRAPYSHSLPLLAARTSLEISEDVIDQLAEYVEFHLESRYPDERKDFYAHCTEDFSCKKFAEMEEVYKWLIEKLKK